MTALNLKAAKSVAIATEDVAELRKTIFGLSYAILELTDRDPETGAQLVQVANDIADQYDDVEDVTPEELFTEILAEAISSMFDASQDVDFDETLTKVDTPSVRTAPSFGGLV